jgi:hypothetical protein
MNDCRHVSPHPCRHFCTFTIRITVSIGPLKPVAEATGNHAPAIGEALPFLELKHQTTRRTRQPDTPDNPSPGIYPKPSTPSPPSSTPGPTGVTGVSIYPPLYPILFPQHTTYLPARSEGVPKRPESEQLPPAAPAVSYWPQSVTLWSTFALGHAHARLPTRRL